MHLESTEHGLFQSVYPGVTLAMEFWGQVEVLISSVTPRAATLCVGRRVKGNERQVQTTGLPVPLVPSSSWARIAEARINRAGRPL